MDIFKLMTFVVFCYSVFKLGMGVQRLISRLFNTKNRRSSH